jgi:hypothetical protein
MPFLFDEFGQRMEVSEGTFYLTGIVDQLFDDMLEILGGRIKVSVFRQNWHQLVAFILFVIRLAHTRAQKEIHVEIQGYISDQNNPESYLNAFNNPEYDTLHRYDSAWLADAVTNAYKKYWDLYDSASKGGEDPSFAINAYLGEMLAANSEDQPNFHDAFSFLRGKFDTGEAKLFED